MVAGVAINRDAIGAVHPHPILKNCTGHWGRLIAISRSALNPSLSRQRLAVLLYLLSMCCSLFALPANIPELVLDENGLRTPTVLWGWPLIGNAWVGRLLGRPVLCISTINDKAVLKRFPWLFRCRFALRRRTVGAPIVLPTMRDTSLLDVCDLIDEYRLHFNPIPKLTRSLTCASRLAGGARAGFVMLGLTIQFCERSFAAFTS